MSKKETGRQPGDLDLQEGGVSTRWIVFLLVALVCVMVAGAVLMRGGDPGGSGSGEVLTASTGWGTTHFSNLSAADIEATDDLTVGDDLTVSDEVSIGTFGRIAEQTAISVTNGATFTPTGSYQPITSAGTVTPTISTSGYTAGEWLVITNESATTVNFADSGTLMLNTARAMGQYDVLGLLFDGTNWLEQYFNDN